MSLSQPPADFSPQAIRRQMLARRRALTPNQLDTAERDAACLLLAQKAWKQAHTVMLYCAVRGELGTAPLLDTAWKEDKQVFLPRCLEGAVMEAALCQGPADLEPGRFGIAEPAAHCPTLTASGAPMPDLILVPGVAFDGFGNRLGHGQGFYDRFLAAGALQNALRIGYAHAFQLIPAPHSLPAHALDIPVQAICTDKEILWI